MLFFKVPPQIYFKRGILDEALRSLPKEISRIMIVTDHVMVRLGYINRLTDNLKSFGFHYSIFDNVLPDPTFECVMEGLMYEVLIEGVKEAKAERPDCIIAFGGGSVMDCAKVIRVLYEHPEASISDLVTRFMDVRKRIQEFPLKGTLVKSLVCIPTTAGNDLLLLYKVLVLKSLHLQF
jgi:acetaldehyde dehydrogenase/alcohol dehydrogenase